MANSPGGQRSDNKDRAEQFGANAGRRVGETFDRAQGAASATAEKAQGRAEDVMRKVQDAASNVAQSVREGASNVTQRAEDAYEATTETISEFSNDVMNLIRRHPTQAMLISFSAGCCIGALMFGGMFAASSHD